MADATVITFLTPSLVAIYSALVLRQPFTHKEQLGTLLALVGVIFIARPASIFGIRAPATLAMTGAVAGQATTQSLPMLPEPTPAERMKGTMLAIASAVGGAGAIINIRSIGDRAHVLTTTVYFAGVCAVFGGLALVVAPVLNIDQPALQFRLPHGGMQLALLGGIVVCGILTQLFLTAGLGSETRSNTAPAMTYTGILWSAGLDRWVFGEDMYWSSIAGCGLIVSSAVWIALQPKPPMKPSKSMAGGGDVEAQVEEARARLVQEPPAYSRSPSQSRGSYGSGTTPCQG